MKRLLKCKDCGGIDFRFRWEYEEKDELSLYMCHDGMGFQLTDAIVTCGGCGNTSQYEDEDFMTTEVQK